MFLHYKSIVYFISILILSFNLIACDGDNESGNDQNNSDEAVPANQWNKMQWSQDKWG